MSHPEATVNAVINEWRVDLRNTGARLHWMLHETQSGLIEMLQIVGCPEVRMKEEFTLTNEKKLKVNKSLRWKIRGTTNCMTMDIW